MRHADRPNTARGGSVTPNGEAIHFCSSGCSEKFKAAPDRYSLPPSGAGAAPESSAPASPAKGTYVCPMHPEVRQQGPGACPKCGMALEPDVPAAPARTEYVCPMHPEIVRDAPGSCPICGMALEPRHASAEEEPNPELHDMQRRFWLSLGLTLPTMLLAMSDLLPPGVRPRFASPLLVVWAQLALSAPVVLWGGWPFFSGARLEIMEGNGLAWLPWRFGNLAACPSGPSARAQLRRAFD